MFVSGLRLGGAFAAKKVFEIAKLGATAERVERRFEAFAETAGGAAKILEAFQKGAGCQTCHDSGFQGRAGIYEVMEVTPPMRRLIHVGAGTHEYREMLRKLGYKTLREEGVLLAIDGKTSLEEALRVTKLEEDHTEVEASARSAA